MVDYDEDILTGSFYHISVKVLVWSVDLRFRLIWYSDCWLFLDYLAGVAVFIEIFQERL